MLLDCLQIPQEWIKTIVNWDSHKTKWAEKAKLARGYFRNDVEGTGTTFTQEQLKNIQLNTNIPVSINYIHPILSQQHAIINEARPSLKVVALDDRGKQYANVLDKAKHAVLYSSDAIQYTDEAIKEMLICGMAHVAIEEVDFLNPGEFNLSFQLIPYENITVDPFQNVIGSNAEGYVYRKTITKSTWIHLYQGMLDTINKYYGTDFTVDIFMNRTMMGTQVIGAPVSVFNQEETCEVSKFVSRAVTTMYYRKDPITGVVIRDFKENHFPEQADALFAEELLVGQPEVNMFTKVSLCWGDRVVAEKFIGFTQLPLRNYYYDWGGSPYTSYGVPHHLISMQDSMDKALQIMLLNGMLVNNPRWKAPKGAFPDEDIPKLEARLSDPRFIMFYQPIPMDGKILVPELEQTPAIGQFYPMIIELMKQGMEYSTGITAIMYGDPTRAKTDVFASLQQFYSSAMKRLNTVIRRVEQSHLYIGRVLIQGLLFYMNEGYYPFFNEKAEFDEVQITRDMLSNLRQSNFMVLAVPSEGTESQRSAMAIELMKISQTTPDPTERLAYIREAFRLSDMRGFDKLQKEIEQIRQLNSTIQQLQEQIKRDSELMKQYENRALDAEYNEKVTLMIAEAKEKLAVAVTEDKLKNEIENLKSKQRQTPSS